MAGNSKGVVVGVGNCTGLITLLEASGMADAKNFEEWRFGHGLAYTDSVASLWAELRPGAEAIRGSLPQEVQPLSSWDWSLNAGDTSLLRQQPYRFKHPAHLPMWVEIWVNLDNSMVL